MTIKSTDTIRVLRILEYIGDRSNIDSDLARLNIKGRLQYSKHYIINEAIIGELSEIVPSIKDKKERASEFIIRRTTDSNKHVFNRTEVQQLANDLIEHLGY